MGVARITVELVYYYLLWKAILELIEDTDENGRESTNRSGLITLFWCKEIWIAVVVRWWKYWSCRWIYCTVDDGEVDFGGAITGEKGKVDELEARGE